MSHSHLHHLEELTDLHTLTCEDTTNSAKPKVRATLLDSRWRTDSLAQRVRQDRQTGQVSSEIETPSAS